ncbi:rhomboid family intramembrane serine protease [Tissierella creatinophila]|uniref:Rhomboid protease GluP n=1 Tax=Tissierella creatinophila DSM 6911 TaxID=1123403 RepID=A0A1U7M847_TISCR|nr:rhomboid family intramembrane serine protease [Tissierella creatinophila]OLS03455.1 rhomboid protease GluP [Tissierella creatinophila DSM 6911]
MKKDNLIEYIKKASVNSVLLAIMLVYFVVITLNGGTTDVETLVRFGALFPPLVKEYGQYYRLISSIFIHIGIMHLFFNSYALYIFGTQIERVMGHKKYILFFLLTGLGGNLLTYIFSYETISAGASGSLFGMFGAFLYLIRRHPEMVTPEGKKSILQLLVINIAITLLVPNISATAHFGGLIAGYLLSYGFIK